MAVSGTGLFVTTAGLVFLWSAVKGAAPTEVIRELIEGKQPSGENRYPITPVAAQSGTSAAPSADAARILQAAASKKGWPYIFGAGHNSNPCASKASDCSSYVSCVLNMVGVMTGSTNTSGFMKIGTAIPYAQRMPGDLIIWNGGTGGGHMGIINTVEGNGGTMWHNPCTRCGGVQVGKYPYGSRSAASANIRRVSR